jgi:hypothetical protein
MAKQKKAEAASSGYWNPKKAGKPDSTISGKFIEFKQGKFTPTMVLNTGSVNMSTVLLNLFETPAPSMKAGDKVKMVFTGYGKGQAGKPSRLFDAYLNGKKLISSGGGAPLKDRAALKKAWKAAQTRERN